MEQLWNTIIESINLPLLLSFLIGIFFGMSLLVMIYLVVVIKSINKRQYSSRVVNDELIQEKVDEAIISIKAEYRKESKSGSAQKHIELVSRLSYDLINDIAKAFYPKSKYPLTELSIDEVLELNQYIKKRIDQLLSRRGLRIFRKLKVSQIIRIYDVKKRLDESKAMEVANKYKISKNLKILFGIINLPNPVYWGRKITLSFGFRTGLKALGGVILDVVADETIKIYSKNLFAKTNVIKLSESESEVKELENLLINEKDG